MHDYRRYGRGRTLEQYCHDEGADYSWIEKAKAQYGTASKHKTAAKSEKDKSQAPELIRLHFDPGQEIKADMGEGAGKQTTWEPGPAEKRSGSLWRIAGLRMLTPRGYEIEIKTTSPAAVTELLSGLIR